MSDYDKEVLTASALLERLDSIERIAARRYELALRTEQRVSIIETDLGHVESDVDDTGNCYADVVPRLDDIEATLKLNKDKDWYPRPGDFIYLVDGDHVLRLDKIEMEIEVMSQIITKETLALNEIEERIAIMQEKIDGID